jgi:hypothetical protein
MIATKWGTKRPLGQGQQIPVLWRSRQTRGLQADFNYVKPHNTLVLPGLITGILLMLMRARRRRWLPG